MIKVEEKSVEERVKQLMQLLKDGQLESDEYDVLLKELYGEERFEKEK